MTKATQIAEKEIDDVQNGRIEPSLILTKSMESINKYVELIKNQQEFSNLCEEIEL